MQIYRWQNPNFISVKPYLKLAGDAKPEQFCNKDSSEIGTVRIAKIDLLPLDTLTPDPTIYTVDIPDYSVELEISIGNDTLSFRRISPLVYIAQTDLIEVPDFGRKRWSSHSVFPLTAMTRCAFLRRHKRCSTG